MDAKINRKAENALNTLGARGFAFRETARGYFCELLPDLFSAHPVTTYIALIDSTQQGESMYAISPEVARFRQVVIDRWGPNCMEIYHRVAMLSLMDAFSERANSHNYPDSIVRQFRLNFARIERKILQGAAGTYPHDGDTFLKDFAICLQTAFPGGGAWVIDHQGGFARSTLFSGGAIQFFRLAWLYLLVTRGHKPMYGLHIHNDLTQYHTAQDRKACHLRLVEMLERNPHVRGICGASWLTDPAIPRISPKLRWVREIPEANGCEYFRVAEDIHGGALTRSRTRRRLFEEGKYIPTSYLNIWPRQRMIAWGKRERLNQTRRTFASQHPLPDA